MAEPPKGPFASPGFHLWHASLRWTQEVARALRALGLTHTQFFLLGAVGWLTNKGPERNPGPETQKGSLSESGRDPS